MKNDNFLLINQSLNHPTKNLSKVNRSRYGIVHSGGVGSYLAEWILRGEPPHDLAECDPDRFMDWANMDYAIAKSAETYGLNNAPPYPHDDRKAGRPTTRYTIYF